MEKNNFNKSWMLTKKITTLLAALGGGSNESLKVDLPHDVLISQPRYADCVSGPGMAYFEGADVTYSKTFFVDSGEKDKVHYIHFDGVYMNATIRLNNRYVMHHAYGYTPFTIRLDEYLNYGRTNTLSVEIRGYAQPNARWYPGLGIYRDVTFMTGNLVHLVHNGIHTTTLDCDKALGSVQIEAQVRNADHHGHAGHVLFAVKDAQGKTVAWDKNKYYISANDTTLLRTRVEVENPALWDAEDPNLYTCEVTLLDGEEVLDKDAAVFGIRKIQLDSRRGLQINGKTVKLRGGCIHHDNAMLGAISLPDAEMRKIALLKTGGYNAVRTAHNPPSAALLEACDKLGMYVMDEFTDVWPASKAVYDYGAFFEENWEKDVEDFVRRDYNHPSVIMWSIGNEIPENGDMISDRWGKKLVEKFKSLDHTRPVTNGINILVAAMGNLAELFEGSSGGINDVMFTEGNGFADIMTNMAKNPKVIDLSQEAADMLDVVGYNYTEALYAEQHELHPDRIFFGSETNPPKIDTNWEIVMNNSYVIGDFCWTGWDYLGEVGGGRISLKAEHNGNFMADYPFICAYQADFNLIGDRRPMSYWRDTVWTGRGHQPYISVHNPIRYGLEFTNNPYAWTDSLPTWSWAGCEGKQTAVEIYADAEEVELIVNGVSQGKKPVGDDFRKFYAKFEVPYHPGALEAITYIGGKEVGRMELKTLGNGSNLCVGADKTTLRAGSEDLCYIMIELRDDSGTLDMLSEKKVTAKVEGAVLAGMGSGDPMTEEYYQWDTHKFFEGKVLAIVKAGETAGAARVTISSEDCTDVTLELTITD